MNTKYRDSAPEEPSRCSNCGGPAIKVTKPFGICSLPAIRCGDENCQNDAVVVGNTYQEAIALWNTRPIEDALRAEIDELRRIRSNMADVIVQQEEEIDKFNAWQEKAVNLYPDLERLE